MAAETTAFGHRGRRVRAWGKARTALAFGSAAVVAAVFYGVSAEAGESSASQVRAGKVEMASSKITRSEKVSKIPKDRDRAAAKQANAGEKSVSFAPVAFSALPGWEADDHLAALKAFVRSCSRVVAAVKSGSPTGTTPTPPGLLSACEDANALIAGRVTRASARQFFESHFAPHRVEHAGDDGLLTGYYEPVIDGSRQRDETYRAAVLKRPADLVNLVAESERGAKADRLTHARQTATGTEPYPTRKEIDQGALAGQGLELLYLKDPVDLFFMQVQGSGRIALPDGNSVRVTYDGKNGHPYTSIGRYLIDKGWFPADRMSLGALKSWLKQNPQKMQDVLWQNRSYVFFRELQGAEAEGPMGVLEIPLSPGRSLAVDTQFHAIGTPVYVAAPEITHLTDDQRPFQRLMIAQDVGSAIRGPERGDIYCGSGDGAGRRAGITKHRGNFYVLLPRDVLKGPQIEAGGVRGKVRQAQQ